MAELPRRADHVGSLLRPARLSAARQQWKDGSLPADELHAIEDECITELAAKEEAVGMRAVTDGEFRRDWWHLDFLSGFADVAAPCFGARLVQLLGAQQAADMVGTERWFHGSYFNARSPG